MKYQKALDGVKHMINMGSIVPVGPKTIAITDYIMQRTRDKLIQNLVQFRREMVDPHGRQIFGDTFPIGQCEYIRDIVYEVLKSSPRAQCPQFPEISPFSIPLRKIWCIQGDKYMNNTLQYGNWIIDAANDTVDTMKYPVTVLKIEDSQTRNPRDHEDLCQVLEKYWPVQCYPNVYYPELAPFFPVIFTHDGKVGFADRTMIGLDMKGVLNGFESAYHFLFQSSFAQKRLPDEYVQMLKGKTLQTEGAVNKHQIQSQFSRLRKLGPSKLAQQILLYYKLLKENKQMVIPGGL